MTRISRPAPPELVAALPGYEIGRELGEGAFGHVWYGVHRHLGRKVAIKQLRGAHSAVELHRARFRREARILADLDVEHVVTVFDFVEHGDLSLLVLEYLAGGSLDRRFPRGRRHGLEDSVAVALAACEGLHHAHERGVLHRDVKPANLLLSEKHCVKVADFGIAKVLEHSRSVLTSTGTRQGTVAYMSPEQASGVEELGPACDVYAVATVLYEMLADTLPQSVDGLDLLVLSRRVHEDPVPLTDVAPEVPRAVADVVMSALARNPRDRPHSAQALALALAQATTRASGSGWLQRATTKVDTLSPVVADACRRGPTAVRVRPPDRQGDRVRRSSQAGGRATPPVARPVRVHRVPPQEPSTGPTGAVLAPGAPAWGRQVVWRPPAVPQPSGGVEPPTAGGSATGGASDSGGGPPVVARAALCGPLVGGAIFAAGDGRGAVVLAAPGTTVHAVVAGRATAGPSGRDDLALQADDGTTWTYRGLDLRSGVVGSRVRAGQQLGSVTAGGSGLVVEGVDATGSPLDVETVLAGLPDPVDVLGAAAERRSTADGDPEHLDRLVDQGEVAGAVGRATRVSAARPGR